MHFVDSGWTDAWKRELFSAEIWGNAPRWSLSIPAASAATRQGRASGLSPGRTSISFLWVSFFMAESSGIGGISWGAHGIWHMTFMCRCITGQRPTCWTFTARIFRCGYCKLGTARQLPVPFSDFSVNQFVDQVAACTHLRVLSGTRYSSRIW